MQEPFSHEEPFEGLLKGELNRKPWLHTRGWCSGQTAHLGTHTGLLPHQHISGRTRSEDSYLGLVGARSSWNPRQGLPCA